MATIGTILLLAFAAMTFVYGIMAFTPTMSCEYTTTGACAHGQLPMKLAVGGTAVVTVASLVVTWARTSGRPRATVPYLGVLVVLLCVAAAFVVADA